MDYKDLKNKTVFDFCDDEKLLKEMDVLPKERHLKFIKEKPNENGWFLSDFALRTGNAELYKAVVEQYPGNYFDDYVGK